MRVAALLHHVLLASVLAAQVVLDGPFINERFVLNVPASPLQGLLPDERFVEAHSSSLRDYTLDEPQYWTKRTFHRILLADNPALQALSGQGGPRSLSDVIRSAIADGRVTLFEDLSFLDAIPAAEAPAPEGPALLLKTDFAYNDSLHRIEAHLIGLGVEGVDGRTRAMYYPELRYVLQGYRIAHATGTLQVDEWFEQWLFIAQAMPVRAHTWPAACANCTPLQEEQAELDALVQLFLVERELEARGVPRRSRRSARITSLEPTARSAAVRFNADGTLLELRVRRGRRPVLIAHYDHGLPDGAFREFRSDGGLMQQGRFTHGLRTGAWTAWWENGNIRSRRQYASGRLEGVQRVYHADGQLRAEFSMRGGQQEGWYVAFHPDGVVRMSGFMKAGFVDGEWHHAQRIDASLRALLEDRSGMLDLDPEAWRDDLLEFDIVYERQAADDRCLLRTCIRSMPKGPVR